MRLRDTMGDGTGSLAWCVVRYPTNVLCMRPLRDGLLIVLTERDANLPALRMAMSHSIRRLNALLDGPGTSASVADTAGKAAIGRGTGRTGVVVPTTGQEATGTRGIAAPAGFGAGALAAEAVRAES